MILAERTKDALQRLRDANWFSRAGKPLRKTEECFELVDSWEDAFKNFKKRSYLKLTDEVRVHVWKELQKVKPEVNTTDYKGSFLKCSRTILPLAEKLREEVIEKSGMDFPQHVTEEIQWYIMHTLLNVQFSNLYNCPFFVTAFKLILSGRFPCGWTSKKLADGNFIIY
ncbi:MAG: hypothetical protein JNJ77_01295 [Planctomycetia bacterium]|nr:hypothetical protein [Planctomycetia bacterium]